MASGNIVNVPIKDGQVDVPSFLEARRQAVMITNEEEEVRRLFNIDQEKKAFSDALVAAAKARDDTSMTPEIAAEATGRVYDSFFVFNDLPGSLRTNLMSMYVNRVHAVYMPLAAVGTILAVSAGGIVGIKYVAHKHHVAILEKQELLAESSLEELLGIRTSVESSAAEISSYVTEKKPSDSDDLNQIIQLVKSQLTKTDDFFNKFKPIEEKVTTENSGQVAEESKTVESILSELLREVRIGKDKIQFNENLVAVSRGLDSLINEVKAAEPINVFIERANSLYTAGMAAVEHRQLKEAVDYRKQLSGIKNDAHEFSVLPAEFNKAYQSVITVVQHEPTRQWAEKMHQDGLIYIQNADVPHLKATNQELNDMAARLNQEYEIFVVKLPNVRTAWPLEWYQFERDRGGRVVRKITNRDYFIRCQAKQNGKVIPVTFHDVAQDKIVTTDMFGYRISDDSLHVDDDTMLEEFKQLVGSGKYTKTPLAAKKKGFPDEEPKYKSQETRMVLPFTDKTAMVPNDMDI